DQLGDPLPTDAVARIGSTRFRHGAYIYSLCFSPDGKRLHSFGMDGLRIWDAASGREQRHLTERPGFRLLRAALSPDGKHAGTTRVDQQGIVKPDPVTLWDLATGKKTKEFGNRSYWRPRFSSDGTVLAAARFDGWIELWDSGGKERASWQAHQRDVRF